MTKPVIRQKQLAMRIKYVPCKVRTFRLYLPTQAIRPLGQSPDMKRLVLNICHVIQTIIRVGKALFINICLCPSGLKSPPWGCSMRQVRPLVPSGRIYWPLRRRAMGHRVNWAARKAETTSQNSWTKRARLYWPLITRPRSGEQVGAEVRVSGWVWVKDWVRLK